MTKKKHTVVYNKTRWDRLLACLCPQILGIISPRLCRKYAQRPQARLVWGHSKKTPYDTLHINPHYKETL